MAYSPTVWRPGSRDVVAVANVRVCLALMRIFRRVPLPVDDLEHSEVAQPFWPLIRQFPELLSKGMHTAPGMEATRRGRRAYDSDQEKFDDWKAVLASRAGIPVQPSDPWIFEYLGGALIKHLPSFNPLFDAIEGKLEALAATQRMPSDTQLDLLSSLLQLSVNEKAYVRLAIAAATSSIGTAPFRVACPPTRNVKAMQASIGAASEHDVRSMLRRSSRLVKSGLVDNEAFHVHSDMEDILRLSRQAMMIVSSGARSIRQMSAVVLQPAQPATSEMLEWPHLEPRAQLLRDMLSRALALQTRGVNVLLYGAPGTGKTQFACRLADSLGMQAFNVADTDRDGDAANRADRLSSLMLTQLFAPEKRSIIVLDEAEDIFQNDYNDPIARALGQKDDAKSWMNHLLEQNTNPVIWISNRVSHIDAAYLRRFTYCMEFPRTPVAVRRKIARSQLESVGCSRALADSIAAEVDVSPALIASATKFAQLTGTPSTRVDATVKTMLSDMVKAAGGKFGGRVPERATRFDLQYLNAKGAVKPGALLDGLGRMGRGRVLLSGPPGTGKTQLAAEIAARLGRELVYKTASDINSMWFGQSERNVAAMFEECDADSEVLFLDEADTLMAGRDAGGHRAEVAVTAEFLRQVEAFQGVFVCATNFQSRLDAALLRRFEFRLEMLPLSQAQRVALFAEAALGWDAAGGQPMPALPADVEKRLGALHLLTPGDFANVTRRVRSLQLTLDPLGWLSEIESEHQVKPGAPRAATMGFV